MTDILRYPTTDPMTLEPHYSRHVAAMTREGLHAKSDIAVQLALRDVRIAELLAALAAELVLRMAAVGREPR